MPRAIAPKATKSVAPTPKASAPIAAAQRTGGLRIEQTVTESLAPRFGFDLSNIHIHSDDVAASAANALGARAFAWGTSVVFGRGEYQPHTSRGRALLAHELAHVSQQLAGDTAAEHVQEKEAQRVATGGVMPFAPMGSPTAALRLAPGDVVSLTIFTDARGGASFRAELESGAQLTGNGSVRQLDPGEYRIQFENGRYSIRYPDGTDASDTTRFDVQGSQRNEALVRALRATTTELPMRVVGGQPAVTRNGATGALTRQQEVRAGLEALPERVRAFLFSDTGKPMADGDEATLLRVGQKLSLLSKDELEEYEARTTGTTSSPAELERAVDAWTQQLEKKRAVAHEADEAGMALFRQESLYKLLREWDGYAGDLLVEPKQITEWEAMPASALPQRSEAFALDAYLRLRHALADYDYANVQAFRDAIARYRMAFRNEAAQIAFEALDRYEHLLLNQQARYGKLENVTPLYQKLAPARQTFQEAEDYRTDQMLSYTGPAPQTYAALWTDPAYDRDIKRGNEQVASLAATDPLLANPDFPAETLAYQRSDENVRSVLLRYIADTIASVHDSRSDISKDADSIFDHDLDVLIEQTKARLGVDHDSIWAWAIDDYRQLLKDRKFFANMALLALTIALTVATFGAAAPVAFAAGVASFGLSAYQAYAQYKEYAFEKDAYAAQLLSTEPWAGWVVIAVIGAGLDLAAVAKTIKPLAAALKEFQATADSADALVKLQSKLVGVDKKVADSIMAGAEAEAQSRKGWQALFPGGQGKGAALEAGAEASGRAVYSVQINARRGVRGFAEWAKSPEAIDLIGDVGKLNPAQLRRAKTLYQFAVADAERLVTQGRKLGLAPDEIEGFVEAWAKKGGSADDALREMAMGNWGRYQKMSDLEVFTKYADEGDVTAAAVIRQRYPDNEAALRKILDKEYRPPHRATAILRRSGKEIERSTLNSGNMTTAEKALGFPRSTLATHTEARAVKQIKLRRGDVLELIGQYDPCGACQKAMREAAENTGATIKYWWQGGEVVFRPRP